MRVLLIDVNYKYSSTGKIVHDLAKELKKSNHDVRVLFGRGESIESDIAVRVASVWEVYFHALMTRLTGLVGFFSYFATKRLLKQIKEFKPDVIHLHELHGYYVNYSEVVRFLKSSNIPVVWTFHCEFAYTGKCGYAYDCEKWKSGCSSCPQIKEYPSSLYFDFTRYMFNEKKKDFDGFHNLTIVTPSHWLARRVKQSFLSDFDIRVVYNGVDTDSIFFPRNSDYLVEKYGLHRKKIVLAVAPNLMDERKGGQWILDLASYYGDDVFFVLIGVKEEVVLNCPMNVVCLPRTKNQSELAEFYSLADVLILTSQKETFSLVTAEGLSCGLPVIGFDSGAPAEVAPAGYGLFSVYGDVVALKNNLDAFLKGDIEFKNKEECRSFAVDNYSNRTMMDAYFCIYTEVLAKSEVLINV
ncbi:MAG: glycosyltransferase [Neptuniibacter caesariensis]|uniref:Glycosyltransferase n=1 Tax=Neptuniibacter caesariensis TaxID=207954 RepID=A0A2G6JN48_NEPCE|nr:MAG: glycosyltransferase [Neptuniibacter caesariensis]